MVKMLLMGRVIEVIKGFFRGYTYKADNYLFRSSGHYGISDELVRVEK